MSPIIFAPGLISIFKECTPRILIFTDGLTFGSGDFGLSVFVDILKSSTIHGMTPIVETKDDSFEFTPATFSKSKYDVLFLFGIGSTGTLPAGEISVISQFMDDGGGVFATGDHLNLGLKLCGSIPRVKGMRQWAGPSAGGDDRISTIDPGSDNLFQFSDQADSIPQKIYPAYTGTVTSSQPHYLLQHLTKKIIEVLPDHPHESVCTVPDPATMDPAEWPQDSSGTTVSPEVVAISVSYGGGFPGKQPISSPKSFNAIVAYDGHLANVGRISTDATWHHFININLKYSTSPDGGVGLDDNTDAYERVSTYYRNIANWLMPKNTRRCLRWPFLITITRFYPVREFLPIPPRPGLLDLVTLGRETQTTMARFMTPAQQQELVDDLFELHSEKLSKEMHSIRTRTDGIEDAIYQSIVPVKLMEMVVLGAVINSISQVFPDGKDIETSFKKIGGPESLSKSVKDSIGLALGEFSTAVMLGKGRLESTLKNC